MTYILIAVLLALSLLIWIYTIRPLQVMSERLSVSIREEIIPDIQKFLGIITTLSSASIVLTFSVLQAFSADDIAYEYILIASWILFSLSIIMSVTAANLTFIYRAQQKVMISILQDAMVVDKETGKIPPDKIPKLTEGQTYLGIVRKAQNRLLVIIYIGSVSFYNAIVLLTAFAVANL